ncbi:MAG: HAMP domain-containing sensor histidine kinase [Gammaproteobacteria bacterium]|nr:HAMP domain-containing sensor histidine kinase [Gammaproteobacteria bacterium]
MSAKAGLGERFGRAFLFQAVLIALAAVLGVYAAAFAIEEVLIKQALRQEASYFWDKRQNDPGFPLPDTLNLTGFMDGEAQNGSVPEELRALEPGFHDLPAESDFSVVYVSERGDRRLFLVFDGEQVGELALYFGLVPLASVLVVIYLLTWLGYRLSRSALSPILWLSRQVHRLDPESPDAAVFSSERLPGNPDREVVALADALERLSRRINEFAERERNFTRDASHELRSPLTVIKIAADMLLSEQQLDTPARNSVLRIRRAAADMEELTEVFLLLARESEHGLSTDPVCINDIIAEEIARAQVRLGAKPVEVTVDSSCRLITQASDKVLSVLFGNLIRNAFDYTDSGTVVVRISPGSVSIEDSGRGMPGEEVERVFEPFYRGGTRQRGGHGVGLTIVKRLSDRFGWPVHVSSEIGVGTRVQVDFPESRCEDAVGPETAKADA